MKKVIIFISLLFLLACNKGVWLTQNVYRPKHPRFSILKKPYIANELIDDRSLYVSTERFVNSRGNVVIGYMGFYSDGRMIVDRTWDTEMKQTLNERNSFSTASCIGYYTTNGNRINMEYFLPGDGGLYETREGVIKKDTIILIEKLPLLFRQVINYDTLVKSSYPLQDD